LRSSSLKRASRELRRPGAHRRARSATAGKGGVIPGGGNPLVGREGDPQDIAAAVEAVCSPAALHHRADHSLNGGIYRSAVGFQKSVHIHHPFS